MVTGGLNAVAGETTVQVCALWESDTLVLKRGPRGPGHSVDKGCSDRLATLPLCSVGVSGFVSARVLGGRVEPEVEGWLA